LVPVQAASPIEQAPTEKSSGRLRLPEPHPQRLCSPPDAFPQDVAKSFLGSAN
jgi:hypothetical protein